MTMDRRTFLGNSSLLLAVAALGSAAEAAEQAKTSGRKYRLVATEEAFSIPE